MDMIRFNRLRAEFERAFQARYGNGVLKTSWHVINWWVDRSGCALQDRESERDKLHKRFLDSCRQAEITASWANCLMWCSSENR